MCWAYHITCVCYQVVLLPSPDVSWVFLRGHLGIPFLHCSWTAAIGFGMARGHSNWWFHEGCTAVGISHGYLCIPLYTLYSYIFAGKNIVWNWKVPKNDRSCSWSVHHWVKYVWVCLHYPWMLATCSSLAMWLKYTGRLFYQCFLLRGAIGYNDHGDDDDDDDDDDDHHHHHHHHHKSCFLARDGCASAMKLRQAGCSFHDLSCRTGLGAHCWTWLVKSNCDPRVGFPNPAASIPIPLGCICDTTGSHAHMHT